jgi:hypothetical protein
MYARRSLSAFLIFAILAFGPFLLFSLITALSLFVQSALLLPSAPGKSILLWVAYGLLSLFIPLLVVFLVYRLYERNPAWFTRAVFLYLAMLILSAGLLYVFNAGIAGSSMAVVDGVASGPALQVRIIEETFLTLLPVQLCVLPWLGVALVVLAWSSRRGFLP